MVAGVTVALPELTPDGESVVRVELATAPMFTFSTPELVPSPNVSVSGLAC